MKKRYWSSVAQGLTPYVPGEQPKLTNLVKLNTNENPYPPSPRVLAAVQQELAGNAERLRLYPDPGSLGLRQSIAALHGLEPAQVFVGNGSDEVLAHVFLGLLKHDKHTRPLLFPDITYSFYPVYCGLYDIGYRKLALDEHFALRVEDYCQAGQPCGGIIFPNPNAPTGCLLARGDIERLLEARPDVVVVVDEAYIDFAEDLPAASAASLVNRYANLLVVQTLSKSRSLAGLRVGFALGHADLIAALECVKDSFNSYPLDRLAQVAASAAIDDREWFETTRQAVIRSRRSLAEGLNQLGFEVLPSAANFVFVRHPRHDAASLAAALRARSIIVRHFQQARIEQFLRITIGSDEQCRMLLEALEQILDSAETSNMV